MKDILLTILFLSQITTLTCAGAAEIDLRCTGKSIEACEQKFEKELNAQKCGLLNQAVHCSADSEDDTFSCTAQTESCSNASSDGFMGVQCSVGEKSSIKDWQLTATWARTALWIWVRSLCKAN